MTQLIAFLSIILTAIFLLYILGIVFLKYFNKFMNMDLHRNEYGFVWSVGIFVILLIQVIVLIHIMIWEAARIIMN